MCAVDAHEKKVIGTAKAFTTIQTDVREGFDAAFAELEASVGRLEYSQKLACSSAGGGLKMIAVGLVPDLTAKAARMAASSAGAKVTDTFSYELSAHEQEEIQRAAPDILLLCGGTDGGNREVIIHNARKIAEIERDFSVIYAGNKSAADDAQGILRKAGKNVIVCKNVMPVFNVLDIAPAKNAIRTLFIERIVEAKGLSRIQKEMTAEIIPTPLAVFEGAELLSKGCGGSDGIGGLMAVDVGGATTDVYTMFDGKPSLPNVVIKGLPEPFAKRSVEGDLGLRYNIDSLAESASVERIACDLQASEDAVSAWISACKKTPGAISQIGSLDRNIDEYLTRHAVKIAVERHCGTVENVYTPVGETILMTGKDLTNVPAVVGIGGPVINSQDPAKILMSAVRDPSAYGFLKPASPKFFLDRKYIFASMGLVGKFDPRLALEIMKDEIVELLT
ncbi:MAG: methylaspartate mutase accessory protein GlmL [Treponema sp.]|nr:methylaspartate mutase accessory protein GlmL [Treponema sp.]